MTNGIISRTRRRQLASRRLLFQALEPRVVLAGNVAASLAGETLRITGDNEDNALLISTFEDPEKGIGFRVEGKETVDGPTTVNGEEEPAEFFGVKNLNIDLRGGDDGLAITSDFEALMECFSIEEGAAPAAALNGEGFHVPGWVIIRMGDGDNEMAIGPAEIGQHLLIQGGKQSDQIGLCDVHVGTNLTVQTFAGKDGISIHDSGSDGTTKIQTGADDGNVEIEGIHARDLIIQGGSADDEVLVAGISVEDDLIVQTFGGDDSVGISGGGGLLVANAEMEIEPNVGDLLLIQTGDGESQVGILDLVAGQINILGGKNDDDVRLEFVLAERDIVITTLGGHDHVEAGMVEARSLIISAGTGQDDVLVGGYKEGSRIHEDLIVTTGSGEDRVTIGLGFAGAAEGEDGPLDGLNVGDDLVVDTGSDSDRIDIFGYHIGGDVVVNAGSGDDSGTERAPVEQLSAPIGGGVNIGGLDIAGNFTLLLGAGRDGAQVGEMSVGGNAVLDAGSGDDGHADSDNEEPLVDGLGLRIGFMSVGGNLIVSLGAGNDQASILEVEVGGNAFFYGGSGDDQVQILRVSVVDDLFAFMGAGDDELSMGGCSAKRARLFGGSGQDTFFDGGNDFDSQDVFQFEEIVD